MKEIKLTSLLKTFSAEEIKEFRKFGSRIDPTYKENYISYSFMQKMFWEK